MAQITLRSAAEQVAAHLQEELAAGVYTETLPGVIRLAGDLGVNHKTVEAALRLLEKDGVLMNQGPGCGRLINTSGQALARPRLRVALFLTTIRDRGDDFIIELRHRLEEAGHAPFFPDKTLADLGMDAARVGRFVKRSEADAWVIAAGSREVLEWFSDHSTPVFALFGRRENLAIAGAGPDKSPAVAAATRHLINLGHTRITCLIPRQHRYPDPAPSVQAYLDELESHDIQVGDFNLPDWEETKGGFQEILESLFRVTPPSAIITDEAFLFAATQQFLARRKLSVPEDVALVSMDNAAFFAWCEPAITHISWDYRPVVRSAIRWAANVSAGKQDIRQTSTKAEFIKGGTV